jgi:hypothetical protein
VLLENKTKKRNSRRLGVARVILKNATHLKQKFSRRLGVAREKYKKNSRCLGVARVNF